MADYAKELARAHEQSMKQQEDFKKQLVEKVVTAAAPAKKRKKRRKSGILPINYRRCLQASPKK